MTVLQQACLLPLARERPPALREQAQQAQATLDEVMLYERFAETVMRACFPRFFQFLTLPATNELLNEGYIECL